MIAVYRANPAAFGGNINILKRGAVLRMPGADEIAALNQSEAMSEVHRQMESWRSSGGAEAGGHLRLVTPGAGSGTGSDASNGGTPSAASGDSSALKSRVKDLEGQLAESQRLLEVRNNELAELQRKLGSTPATKPTPAPAPVTTPAPTPPPPVAATPAPQTPPAREYARA